MSKSGNIRVVPMFMGTRADHTPHPLSVPVFAWDCEKCGSKTYSVAKPPPDTAKVCNVCVSQITAVKDPATKVAWSMTKELDDSVRDIANEKRLPAEEVFNRFLEWKLGRPSQASFYNKPEKKKAKE